MNEQNQQEKIEQVERSRLTDSPASETDRQTDQLIKINSLAD